MAGQPVKPEHITTAAEVIRSITPPVLATLVAVRGPKRKTQEEIASEVGCARSTVSKYFRTLEGLPLSVIEKRGHSVTVTDLGERVIEIYESTLESFGIDLEHVDWATEETSGVEAALSPLYRFRSEAPFFVFAGLLDLSKEEGHEVWLDDLIIEVESITEGTDTSMSKQHFDQILDNLERHGTITRDDDEVRLTEKGHHQGQLLTNFITDILKRDTSIERESPPAAGTDLAPLEDHAVERSPRFDPAPEVRLGSIAEQDAANAFGGGRLQSAPNAAELGPVVCVETETGVRPIGPLKGTDTATLAETLRTVAAQLDNVTDQHDRPLSAGIYRCLVRGDEISPLGNDWQPLGDASFAEWHMVNKAYRLIENTSRE